MVMDMVQWGFLVAIPVFGYAAALHMLYKDSYDHITAVSEIQDCWFDPDKEFDSLSRTMIFLIEAMLNTDGGFQCFRQSTHAYLGAILIYSYVAIMCIMFVNMLIALMAKTFDNVFEAQEVHYLFLKARTIEECVLPRGRAFELANSNLGTQASALLLVSHRSRTSRMLKRCSTPIRPPASRIRLAGGSCTRPCRRRSIYSRCRTLRTSRARRYRPAPAGSADACA
eukprot:4245068-Prymnesium_polylepis.1